MRFKNLKINKCVFIFLFKDLTDGLWTGYTCVHRLVPFKTVSFYIVFNATCNLDFLT